MGFLGFGPKDTDGIEFTAREKDLREAGLERAATNVFDLRRFIDESTTKDQAQGTFFSHRAEGQFSTEARRISEKADKALEVMKASAHLGGRHRFGAAGRGLDEAIAAKVGAIADARTMADDQAAKGRESALRQLFAMEQDYAASEDQFIDLQLEMVQRAAEDEWTAERTDSMFQASSVRSLNRHLGAV